MNDLTQDRRARHEAKRAELREYGFDETIIHIGGSDVFAMLGGGPSEVGMCLTCFSLVPIVDMTDGTTAIRSHAEWHAR